MIDNWWYQQGLVKNFFEVQIEPIFSLCPNYFCLQIYYLDFYLQAFFYFAYYDRKQWFLVGTGGFSRQKIFWGPNWAHFWHMSKLLLSPNLLSWLLFTSFFFNFAYYDRKQWYLTDLGGSSPQKNICVFNGLIKAFLRILDLDFYW